VKIAPGRAGRGVETWPDDTITAKSGPRTSGLVSGDGGGSLGRIAGDHKAHRAW
jgi:hypothetical protein